MRALRLLSAMGLSIGVCALAAPVASACIIDSFGSPQSADHGITVRPGDRVDFSIYAIGTADSPPETPYRVMLAGRVVASGTAVADAGSVTTERGSFEMPSIGASKQTVTMSVFADDPNSQPNPVSIAYDGTPASTSQDPVPTANSAPPAESGTQPATSSEPATAPAGRPSPRTAPAARTTPRARQPHVRPVLAPSATRPTPKRAAAPVARATHPAPVAVTTPRTEPVSTQPVVAVDPKPALHARVKVREHAHAKAVARAMPRGVATDPAVVAVRPVVSREVAQPAADTSPLLYAGGALLLALLIGGGGLAAAMARRRRDVPEPPKDRLAEMEAELQEILAEERVRADTLAREREPV